MAERVGWSGYLRLGLFVALLLAMLNPACGKPEGACAKNGDCTDLKQECSASTNTCADIVCEKKADCRGEWFCNTKTRKCQKTEPVECQADTDCSNVQACEAGKCVLKAECQADADCSNNQTCTDSKCVDVGCKEDSDCESGKVCKDSKCEDKTAECSTNDDCKDSSKPECKEGTCVAKPGCESNADCTDPAKPICSSRECIADPGGKEGDKCDKTKADCKSGLVCHEPDNTKSEGICRASCLTYSGTCESGKVCQQAEGAKGACVPSNKGKQAGEECDKDSACELNLGCITWKKKKICGKLCDKNAPSCASGEECYEAQVERHFCVSEREPCGPGRGCEDDEVCVSGRCNPPPSCDTVKCKDTEVCEAGFCRDKKCPTEIQCPTGQGCDQASGKCVQGGGDPPCVACQATAPNCATGQECIGGLGTTSTDRYCFENCDSTPCTDTKNFQCQTINLTNSLTCTSDADCGDPLFTCDSNGSCNRNAKLCIPIIGTCKNQCKGVSCSAGDICVPTTGKCITPGKKLCDACTAHQECGSADDRCVNYGAAGTFCGQDCRTTPCPTGYQCFNLSDGVQKQCAPPGLMCPP